MPPESNPLLRAALAYSSQLHWPVFPLKPRAKEPLTKHGFQDAALDEEIIRGWWKKWPEANIGIPTGVAFWALDVDPRHGGDESLAELVHKHGPLSDTIRQTTGGGGQQYLYLMPDQQIIGCYTGVWPGIDVRGVGGYIVVPPSIHPSGNPYIWDTAKRSILNESLELARSWLISGITASSHQSNGQPFHLPEKIRKGVQHKTLFRMGSAMRAVGCDYDEIFRAMWDLNQNRCEEPGPRLNIEKLAQSICKQYEPGSSRNRGAPVNGEPAPPGDGELPDASQYKKPIFTWRSVGCVWDLEVSMNWLIDGFLPEGSITMLSGDSGSGKSIFATAIAGAVVNGMPFLGMETKKRKVLYMDRENPLSAARQHLFDLHIERNEDLIYWGTWCEVIPDGPAAASLLELAREEKPLIIWDALVAFHGGDEQSATETRAFLQHLRNLASAGATILILHHTGKSENSKQYRGSSDIKASVDCAYLLERLDGDPAGLIGDLRLVPFKNRFQASKAWSLVFEDGRFRNQQRTETTREVVERLVRDNPGLGYEELRDKARLCGLAKHQAEAVISDAVTSGRFEVRKAGRARLYFIREVELG